MTRAEMEVAIEELRSRVDELEKGKLAKLQATLDRIDGRLDAQATMLAENSRSINQLTRKVVSADQGIGMLLDHFGLSRPPDDDTGGGTPSAS